MLLAGIDTEQIGDTLKPSPAGLDAQLETVLRKLEDPRFARRREPGGAAA